MWPWMPPSSIQKVWFISPVTAGAVPVKASTSSGRFQWVPASTGSAITLLPWGDGGWAPWPVRQHRSCPPASPLSASIPPVWQHLPCPPASLLSTSISPVRWHLPCLPASHLSTSISSVCQHPTCPPASHLSTSFSTVHQHLPCPPASPLSAASHLSASIPPVLQHPLSTSIPPSPPATQLSDLEMGCSDSPPSIYQVRGPSRNPGR